MAFLAVLCVSTFSRKSPIEVAIELSATTGELGELFYAAPGESIAAGRSVKFRIADGYRRHRLRLPVEALSILRLDPGTDKGSVSIRSMTVRQGRKVLALVDGPRLTRLAGTHGIRREGAAADATTFRATDADPYITFAIPRGFSGSRPWHRALGWGALSALVFALADVIVAARLRRRPELARRVSAWRESVGLRFKHPAWPWLSLGLAPAAGLLWARGHVLPTLMCLSLCLALMSTALAGVVAQSWIDGMRTPAGETARRPGIFQILWLGQYAMFALAIVMTPFFALLTDVTGIRIPYRLSLPLLVVLLALVTLRAAHARAGSLAWPSAASAPPAALVLMALFRAMHLHSVHAGALGHDTQQHIYWAQHIADFGFLPLTARGSDMLDDYPKYFHALSAAWSALGLTAIVGPYVKIMPALQVTLACAFFCELLPSMLGGREAASGRGRPLLRVVLGGFVAWHVTFGDGQQIYDGNDLSGTPRLAAAWVLLGLPLLLLAHRARTIRGASPWIVGLAPVLLVVGFGMNPVLVVLYLSYSLPLTVLLAVLTREGGMARLPLRWWRSLAIGGIVSALLLLANPFVVGVLARTRLGAEVLGSLGIRTVLAGLPALPSTTQPPALCETPLASCLSDLTISSVDEGVQRFVDSMQQASLPAFGSGKYSFVYWLLFSAPLFVAAVRRLADPGAPSRPSRHGSRTFLAILAASAAPAVIYPVVRALLEKLAGQSNSFLLLSAYYASLQMFLGAWVRCLLPLSSWLLLPASAIRGASMALPWLTVAASALVGLTDFQIDSLASHRNASRPWTIDWPELRAIRHLNDFVPSHETVLLPARHVFLHGREDLLMAPDPVGPVGTELRTRTLFMIRLGVGLDFGPRDLEERFCGGPEHRRSFLRSVNARWVLVRAADPGSRAHLKQDLWRCGVTLQTLDAEYPPAWSERDLALYRINP